ncbi:hypothetical protein KP509_1Z138700 [Ceratopteris richardii]|nr:hypothetical protein KP509_1Z138700 [Ceratopteris richardii]
MDIQLSNHVKNPAARDKAQKRLIKEENSSNDLQTSRPYAKLDHQIFSPFIIVAKINLVTFKLQLPSTIRIHLVFHVSLLVPYQISPWRGERPSPSPPIEIEDHEEFEVEHVLDSRISRGRLEYLIHWKGYDISDRTWGSCRKPSESTNQSSRIPQEKSNKTKTR